MFVFLYIPFTLAGVECQIHSLPAFIPASQIRLPHVVVRKVFSSVHLDGVESYHSPDNQLLQRPFVTPIYFTHEQQVAHSFLSLTGYLKDFPKEKIVAHPAQYTRLISFTPPANKPGELHRINILVIEISSYLTKHNSRLIKS